MTIKKIFILTSVCLFSFCFGKGNVFSEQVIFPEIMDVSPAFNAVDVEPNASISITFNAKMNRKTAESNFYIFPQTEGKFQWENGTTLVFKPAKLLLPSTTYIVSLTPEIKGADGIPLILAKFKTIPECLLLGKDKKIHVVSKSGNINYPLCEGNNPAWMPDNRSVVFDDQGQIWKIDVAGDNKTQITSDKSLTAVKPVCNPVSGVLTFVGKNAAGVFNIYTIEEKTLAVKQLSAFFDQTEIGQVSWSADGLYLAFLKGTHVWVANHDGTDMRRLTTSEVVCKNNFAWSPGGTKIAFSGQENVWLVDIYSAELRKVSFDNPKTGILDWSGENKIIYEADGLSVIEPDGSHEANIASAARFPAWVDGEDSFSAVLSLRNKEDDSQLWFISADGLKKEKIALINTGSKRVVWSKHSSFAKSFFP